MSHVATSNQISDLMTRLVQELCRAGLLSEEDTMELLAVEPEATRPDCVERPAAPAREPFRRAS